MLSYWLQCLSPPVLPLRLPFSGLTFLIGRVENRDPHWPDGPLGLNIDLGYTLFVV